MRDLVDTLIQENLIQENLWAVADCAQLRPPAGLSGETLQPGEQWCRIDLLGGWVCFRACQGAALQAYRLARPPVWHGERWDAQPCRLEPDALLVAGRSGAYCSCTSSSRSGSPPSAPPGCCQPVTDGERAQRTIQQLIERDTTLRRRVRWSVLGHHIYSDVGR